MKSNVIAYESKKKCLWKITFGDEKLNEISDFVQGGQRPIYDTIKGWQQMTFSFSDPVCPSVSQRLIQLIEGKGELDTISFALELLDPIGNVVERWEITGEIDIIDFGKLDIAMSEAVFCNLKIQPTKIKLVY